MSQEVQVKSVPFKKVKPGQYVRDVMGRRCLCLHDDVEEVTTYPKKVNVVYLDGVNSGKTAFFRPDEFVEVEIR